MFLSLAEWHHIAEKGKVHQQCRTPTLHPQCEVWQPTRSCSVEEYRFLKSIWRRMHVFRQWADLKSCLILWCPISAVKFHWLGERHRKAQLPTPRHWTPCETFQWVMEMSTQAWQSHLSSCSRHAVSGETAGGWARYPGTSQVALFIYRWTMDTWTSAPVNAKDWNHPGMYLCVSFVTKTRIF